MPFAAVLNRRLVRLAALAAACLTAACSVVVGDTLPDAQQVIADMKLGTSDLKIIGAVDRDPRRYRVGEPIALSAQVTKAAYVAILRVMPNGATTLIFPNRRQTNAQVPANAVLRVPDAAGPLDIAGDKPGVVLFEFVASDRAGSWLFTRRPTGSADFAELGATTRALAKDIVDSLKIGRGPETAAAHLTVRIESP